MTTGMGSDSGELSIDDGEDAAMHRGAVAADTVTKSRVVSIVGPTASGKTGLGIALADALSEQGQRCEIVNADAYQMYKGMNIGTAKPSQQERLHVTHHLLDVIEPNEIMSVARFQQMARERIENLQSQGIRPILVGGSGLYARAALDDIRFPGTDAQVRQRLEHRASEEGPGILFEELRVQDPDAAEHMNPHNVRRTIRALEVIAITGMPYSANLPHYRYVIPSVQIGLDLPRQALDERINLRTEQMRQQGFVDEVRAIRSTLGPTAARALGYQQIIDYLDGLIDEDEAFADIAQKTKRLARKQMGWFGRDPRIHWLQALNPNLVEKAVTIVQHADVGDYDSTDALADTYTQHHLGALEG